MSTSTKTRASIRQGGPGASEENAKAPLEIKKPPADSDHRTRSRISGGGGEHDRHHSHDPERKGDTRPARGVSPAPKTPRIAGGNENYVTPARRKHISNADKKHFGKGTHGKGDGSGAMTNIPKDMLGENMVLSNRDKAQHSRERGLDGKAVKTEQYQDHSAGRLPED
jgi:hypothetical protein